MAILYFFVFFFIIVVLCCFLLLMGWWSVASLQLSLVLELLLLFFLSLSSYISTLLLLTTSSFLLSHCAVITRNTPSMRAETCPVWHHEDSGWRWGRRRSKDAATGLENIAVAQQAEYRCIEHICQLHERLAWALVSGQNCQCSKQSGQNALERNSINKNVPGDLGEISCVSQEQ